ncbi:hypothetical protein VPH35_046931 [Triticum aestivum]
MKVFVNTSRSSLCSHPVLRLFSPRILQFLIQINALRHTTWPQVLIAAGGRGERDQAARMNLFGGSGIGSGDMPPPQHQQLEEVMGHGDPMLVAMRNNYRQRILEHAERVVTARLHKGLRVPADWQRGLPELARRVEKVLFEKHPNKREYYNMTNEPIHPHFEFAVTTSLAQTERQRASSTAYARVTQGDTTNELVSTVLSLGMNSSDDHSQVSNSILANRAPANKEVSKEPKFTCPFCFDELVDATMRHRLSAATSSATSASSSPSRLRTGALPAGGASP